MSTKYAQKISTSLRRFTSLLAATGVAFGVLLLLAVPQVNAQDPPAAGGTTTGICFDGLAGVATKCPAKTDFKIDGKSPANFDTSKCYRIDDPEKGWTSVNVNCGDQVFKDVIDTQSVPSTADRATSKTCPAELDTQGNCDLVALYLNPAINALSVVVVLAVVITIIIAGIQYSASTDQPQAAAAARQRIFNAIIALVCYLFLFGFLQWAIPGGLL